MKKLNNKSSFTLLCGFFLLLIVFLAACGGAAPEAEAPQAAVEEPAEEAVEEVEEAVEEEMMEEEMAEEAEPEIQAEEVVLPVSASSSEDEEGSPHEPGVGAKAEPTRAAAEVAMAEAEVRVADGEAAEVDTIELASESLLTAGEIDDNELWDDYLLYLRQYKGPEIIWVDVVERHILTVLDGDGRPIAGEAVEILAAGQVVQSLVTHSDGSILIFPNTFDLEAEGTELEARFVETGDLIAFELGTAQREWELVVDSYANQSQVKLDVHFLIDTTGSMADEINQLRDNMIAISQQIDALPAAPDVRYGMTLYRDRDDAYHVEVTDFTPDVSAFVAELNQVEADGGGDYPEDLSQGLLEALAVPEWRIENTVSLIFLIADAPPHIDYADAESNYAEQTMVAAESGIKIFSIASSGLDSQGEYVFRQMAQMTGGRFIFLTYGDEGAGSTGGETDMTIDAEDFTVEALDDLIVQIIEEEVGLQSER
ncbi:MAG: VWA domain-containing protein [Anaerolineae bacterium]